MLIQLYLTSIIKMFSFLKRDVACVGCECFEEILWQHLREWLLQSLQKNSHAKHTEVSAIGIFLK